MSDKNEKSLCPTIQAVLATSAVSNMYSDIVVRSVLMFVLCFANALALMTNHLEFLREYRLVYQMSLCMSFMLMLMMLSSMETRANAIKSIKVPVGDDEVIQWLTNYKHFKENNTSYFFLWFVVVGLDLASLGDMVFNIDNTDFILAGTLFGIVFKVYWGIHMTYYHNKLAKAKAT